MPRLTQSPGIYEILSNTSKSGDITIESEEEAYRYQSKIEEALQHKLGYQIHIGDTILAHFDNIPGQPGGKGKRRKSKVFER